MKLNASLVVATLLMSACAGTPVSDKEAKPVPAARILAPDYQQPTDTTGSILVKRDAGIGGSACTTRIFVNAKPQADIDTAEMVIFHLAPGDYIVAAWPNGMCAGRMTEVTVAVKQGETKRLRVGYGTNGDFAIGPTAF